MVQFKATIEKFGANAEKTGWTYLVVPARYAAVLHPGDKKGFRVKGYIDAFAIEKVSLLPKGDGDYIMALNAAMRKGIARPVGARVSLRLEADTREAIPPPPDFLECLDDDPQAKKHFETLARSHQRYFYRWISEAKTDETRAKRIAAALNGLARGFDYGQTIRSLRAGKIV